MNNIHTDLNYVHNPQQSNTYRSRNLVINVDVSDDCVADIDNDCFFDVAQKCFLDCDIKRLNFDCVNC